MVKLTFLEALAAAMLTGAKVSVLKMSWLLAGIVNTTLPP